MNISYYTKNRRQFSFRIQRKNDEKARERLNESERWNENTKSFNENLKNSHLELPTKKIIFKNIENYANISSKNFISEENRKIYENLIYL